MTDPGPGLCGEDVCITCGDVAIAVPIVELLPGELALVDAGGRLEEVSVALVEAEVGTVVLVHAGEAIAVAEAPS